MACISLALSSQTLIWIKFLPNYIATEVELNYKKDTRAYLNPKAEIHRRDESILHGYMGMYFLEL